MFKSTLTIFLLFAFFFVSSTNAKWTVTTYDSLKYKPKADSVYLPKIFDSSKVNVRENTKYFQSLLQSKHFVYNDVPPNEDLISKIQRFIGNILNRIFRILFGDTTRRNIFVMIAICLLIIIIIFILRRNSKSVMYSDKSLPKGSVFLNEIDQKTDFSKLIEEALAKRDYQLAFRYSYLYVLQQLVGRNLIKWTPAKTNFDYYYEISDNRIKNEYKNLSNLFNYIEYGNFSINEADYLKTKEHFDRFKLLIEGLR